MLDAFVWGGVAGYLVAQIVEVVQTVIKAKRDVAAARLEAARRVEAARLEAARRIEAAQRRAR